MDPLLDRIRFSPERELIDDLFVRYDLEKLIVHYESTAGPVAHEYVLGTQLRLTPLLAPRLLGLLDEVRETIAFTEPTQLFVQAEPSVNAMAIHSQAEGMPHIVSLTSGLVEMMSDDELRFVLGHELGHLHYRHYRAGLIHLAVGEDDEGDSKLPGLLARKMESWERLAELSADRVGFAAVGGRVEPAITAFFKMASGLGPEHLRFDVNAFLAQLEDLQSLQRREVLAQFSHPVTPVRVRALQLYGEAGGMSIGEEAHRAVDQAVARIARLMDHEVSEPLEVQERDFLLSAGLLAAYSDGTEITDEEWEVLVALLLPLCADPEVEIARIESVEQATELLESSAAWLRDNAGQERYTLFHQLTHLVAVDGRLQAPEQEFMLQVAEKLQIPERSARDILYETLAGYLQMAAHQGRPSFRLIQKK